MLYKVIRTCYWHNRLYEKGELVDIDAKDIPEHFTRILSAQETLAERALQQKPTAESTDSAEAAQEDANSNTQGEPAPEEEKAENKPLDKMTNFELRALAKKNGIEFSKNATNTELIAAIRGE